MVALGIDIGFSKTSASTGICVISANHKQPIRTAHVTTAQTLPAVRRLLAGERPTTISIDGPLVSMKSKGGALFQLVNHYRECEKNLSGGIFQKRCKPGPTNCPRGQGLHRQATMVAETMSVEHPTAAIWESFPNAFLGVMMPDAVFRRKIRRGIKSDIFWQQGLRRGILGRLVDSLYDEQGHALPRRWRQIKNHDQRAAFICALAARAAELGMATHIGNGLDGRIVLPSGEFIQPWAKARFEQPPLLA
jgi:predicted nuclease with RNAse H fold